MHDPCATEIPASSHSPHPSAALPWAIPGQSLGRTIEVDAFVRRNVARIIEALPGNTVWHLHLSVYTPPQADGGSDLNWLFVDVLSGEAVFAFSLVAPVTSEPGVAPRREDFSPVSWRVDADNPFGAQVLAADLPEAWAVLHGVIEALSIDQMTFSFGS